MDWPYGIFETGRFKRHLPSTVEHWLDYWCWITEPWHEHYMSRGNLSFWEILGCFKFGTFVFVYFLFIVEKICTFQTFSHPKYVLFLEVDKRVEKTVTWSEYRFRYTQKSVVFHKTAPFYFYAKPIGCKNLASRLSTLPTHLILKKDWIKYK